MDDESTEAMSLVVPFTVCKSQGGPYEDQSFTAGFQAGSMFTMLEVTKLLGGANTMPRVAYQQLVPLLDLIAMRFGYTVDYDMSEYADWVTVTFKKEGL